MKEKCSSLQYSGRHMRSAASKTNARKLHWGAKRTNTMQAQQGRFRFRSRHGRSCMACRLVQHTKSHASLMHLLDACSRIAPHEGNSSSEFSSFCNLMR